MTDFNFKLAQDCKDGGCQYAADLGMPEFRCAEKCQYALRDTPAEQFAYAAMAAVGGPVTEVPHPGIFTIRVDVKTDDGRIASFMANPSLVDQWFRTAQGSPKPENDCVISGPEDTDPFQAVGTDNPDPVQICDHEWEQQPYREGESHHKLCILCGLTEDIEPDLDPYPDRDYSEPYEP